MEWIDWEGGECPVPADTRTEVRYRTEETYIWDDPEIEDWLHYKDDPFMDIIAYRILP